MLATLLGLTLRLDSLDMLRGEPLDPDAQTYQAQAAGGGLLAFWDGQVWAPAWIYLLRLWFFVFGVGDSTQRGLTLVLSLVAIAGTFALSLRLFGRAAAAVAALLVALSPMLAFSAARGLREEVLVLEVLVLLWLLAEVKSDPRPAEAIAAGATVGLAGLTRMEMLVPFALSVAVGWLKPFRPRALLLAGSAAALLLLPHLVAVSRAHGDPLHWSKVFTRAWINHEYELGYMDDDTFRRSAPGPEPLPTKEEIRKNLYAGPPLSPVDWYFKVNTPRESLERTIVGTVLLPPAAVRWAVIYPAWASRTLPWINRHLLAWRVLLFALVVSALVGGAWSVLRRQPSVVAMLFGGSLVYALPFTAGLRLSLDPEVDMRLAEFMVPLIAAACGGAVQLVAGRIGRRRSELPREEPALGPSEPHPQQDP